MTNQSYMSGNEFINKILSGERDFSNIKLEKRFNLNKHEGFVTLNDYLKSQTNLSDNPIIIDNSDLKGITARELHLPYISGKSANLRWAKLYKSNFECGNFEGVEIRFANFIAVNFECANLYNAIFRSTNLRDSNMRYANLEGADISWANLEGANLERVNLEGANLERANLGWANLEGANLRDSNLKLASLIDANLKWAKIYRANLEGANLNGTRLEKKYSLDKIKKILKKIKH